MLFRIFFLGEIRKMYYYKFHKQLARTSNVFFLFLLYIFVVSFCSIFLKQYVVIRITMI